MPQSFFVFIPKSVLKSLEKIPLPWQSRIKKAIDALQPNPFYGEKMVGKLKDKRKIRVWPYRIIYQILKKELLVLVIRVGHGQGVYK